MKKHPILCGLFFCSFAIVPANAADAPPPGSPGYVDVAKTEIFRNLIYATPDGTPLGLDLYLPKNGEGPFPLVIFIHGGGWTAGDKTRCPAVTLIPEGFAVASINYRLTGSPLFPANLFDCKAAVRWLRANAKKYHLDPARVGVWGASAGAHLAAMLGVTGGMAEFEGDEGNPGVSSRVQAVCASAAPSDLVALSIETGPKGIEAVESFIGGSLADKGVELNEASPVFHISKEDPPFLLVHGDADRLVATKQSVLFSKELEKAGVSVKLVLIPGGHEVCLRGAIEPADQFFVEKLGSGKTAPTP